MFLLLSHLKLNCIFWNKLSLLKQQHHNAPCGTQICARTTTLLIPNPPCPSPAANLVLSGEKGGWLLLVSLDKVVTPSPRMSHQFPGALSQLPGDRNQPALPRNHSSSSFPAEIPGAQSSSGDGPAPLQTDCLWDKCFLMDRGRQEGITFCAGLWDQSVAEPSHTCGHAGCAWIWNWCAHTNPTGTGKGHLCPESQPVPWGAASKLCIPTDCSWSPEGLSLHFRGLNPPRFHCRSNDGVSCVVYPGTNSSDHTEAVCLQ